MSSFIKHYIVLIIFIGLLFVGVIIRYGFGKDSFLWEIWSVIDVSLAVSLGVLAFIAYGDMVKDEDEIKLFFKLPDGDMLDTGLTLLRRNFTRSEILGVLGMIQKNHKNRFTILSLQKLDFLKQIHILQKGTKREFYIVLNNDEIEQFEVSRS